ncbi:secretion chaperone CsaA [Desmospora sp. 8437]|nr:secretion chaperone CsaA [Desmospora sp. 8437]
MCSIIIFSNTGGIQMAQIQFDDFLKVEIRTGKILRAESFPKARKPAYKLWIDFGEELGVKKSSAQITKLYTLEELAGMRVLAVTNFPPRQVADFMSEVLVLGVETEEGEVALIQTDREVPLGKRIS